MLNRKSIVLLISIIIYFAFVYLLWEYSIDDAFITFRYAENLANGYGFVFNPGGEAVEGFSNFLWLLILSLLYKVGLSTYMTAKILGIASFLTTGIICYLYFRDHKIKYLWLTGPLFLICPISAFWAVSGLELGLHSLLMVGSVILLFRRSGWINLLLPLIILSRPEGFIISGGIIITGAIYDWIKNKITIKFYLVSMATLVAFSTLLVIFRFQVFGYLFPNTFYAKTYHDITWGYMAFGKTMLMFFPFGLAMLWWLINLIKSRKGQKITVVLMTLFTLQAVISSSVDPVMNFLFRYMIPFLPMMLIVSLTVASKIKKSNYQITLISLFIISLMIPYYFANNYYDKEKDIIKGQNKFIELSMSFPENSKISLTDMGRIPYYTTHFYYDLWGLLNRETAHEGFDPKREFLRLPDYFVMVGYLIKNKLNLRFAREKSIAKNENFHDAYQFWKICLPDGKNPNDAGYYYMVFRRKANVLEKYKNAG